MEELGYTDDEMSALPITVVQEVHRLGGGSVMMWAAISHAGKTALVHIPGNLTAQRYCDEILLVTHSPVVVKIAAVVVFGERVCLRRPKDAQLD
jgi:hypothetical protein